MDEARVVHGGHQREEGFYARSCKREAALGKTATRSHDPKPKPGLPKPLFVIDRKRCWVQTTIINNRGKIVDIILCLWMRWVSAPTPAGYLFMSPKGSSSTSWAQTLIYTLLRENRSEVILSLRHEGRCNSILTDPVLVVYTSLVSFNI